MTAVYQRANCNRQLSGDDDDNDNDDDDDDDDSKGGKDGKTAKHLIMAKTKEYQGKQSRGSGVVEKKDRLRQRETRRDQKKKRETEMDQDKL